MIDIFLKDNDPGNPIKHDFIKEIYLAISSGALRLATLGIRALLEHVMIENVGDRNGFVNNLDAFQAEGFMPKIQRQAIEPVLEAGHASMHRGFNPTHYDVTHLLDVTEDLIRQFTFIRPGQRCSTFLCEN
jgi:hypothetical protein